MSLTITGGGVPALRKVDGLVGVELKSLKLEHKTNE